MVKESSEPIAGSQDNIRDRRARISAKPLARDKVYGPRGNANILNPLYQSGGLLFPYTPTINDTATVNYEMYEPVHTNQPFAAFKSVAAKEITIIGTFTTMNKQEAKQNIANVHFLRTITKMYFGAKSSLRGTPPPILLFNAYGTAMYHNVPVIVTTFNVELPQDVDYVYFATDMKGNILADNVIGQAESGLQSDQPNSQTIFVFDPETGRVEPARGTSSGSITAWLPTRFIISVTMTVQNTPDRLRREFDLDAFRTGSLITKGGWV